ncbi:MAG: type II toxin-antitoxin system VapC family toxin [Planctomycetes bacterium]|nr:type II toxin-antitoxin system VapC family toxin [Planctomycetota bacterium]
MPIVYVETTIPSFYCDERTTPAVVFRRELTRIWWPAARSRYDLVTSQAVLAELRRAPEPKRTVMLAMMERIPVLALTEQALRVAKVYVAQRVMPRDPGGDAMHLALASVNGCDYLATWNCRHLANAEKLPHIRAVNGELGLPVPILATPEQLMEEAHGVGPDQG